jgi:hypothetical protein
MSQFKVLSWNLPGRTEENYEKPQSEYLVSGPRFEPGISRIRSRRVSHSTAMFDSRTSFANTLAVDVAPSVTFSCDFNCVTFLVCV